MIFFKLTADIIQSVLAVYSKYRLHCRSFLLGRCAPCASCAPPVGCGVGGYTRGHMLPCSSLSLSGYRGLGRCTFAHLHSLRSLIFLRPYHHHPNTGRHGRQGIIWCLGRASPARLGDFCVLADPHPLNYFPFLIVSV